MNDKIREILLQCLPIVESEALMFMGMRKYDVFADNSPESLDAENRQNTIQRLITDIKELVNQPNENTKDNE